MCSWLRALGADVVHEHIPHQQGRYEVQVNVGAYDPNLNISAQTGTQDMVYPIPRIFDITSQRLALSASVRSRPVHTGHTGGSYVPELAQLE